MVKTTITKESSGYLSVLAEELLSEMYSDSGYCVPYNFFAGGKSPENVAAIKELKEHGMLEFHRGLMDWDEMKPAGSGWCRSTKGNKYVDEFEL